MKYRFAPIGLLALAPSAYGQDYDLAKPEQPRWICNGSAEEPAAEAPKPTVAIVTIRGPLVHHPEPWKNDGTIPPDNYDEIRQRVAWALRMPGVCAVVLSIDSPGGLVNGCFENARMVRAMADAAGVPLHCYVDGQCCSAAYAWASVCRTITAPATAVVGSIGVLDCVVDATAADRQMGVKFAVIASGARKADSNPHTPMTDDSIAAAQARVDDLASFFFDFVAEHRPALTAETVKGLQAEIYIGAKAKTLQLVDNVLTLDALVASLTENPEGKNMAAKTSALMTALVAAMASDDPEEKSQARKAMAAVCADDEEKPEPKKGEDPKAEGGEEEEPPKKKDEEAAAAPAAAAAVAPAAAVASAAAVSIDTRLTALEQSEKAKRNALRSEERRTLLAARPDLAPAMLAVLIDPKQTPLEALRAILPTIPQPTGVQASAGTAQPAAKPTAAPPEAVAAGTAKPGAVATAQSEYSAELDRKMGLGARATVTPHWDEQNPANFAVPIMTPPEARAYLAAQKATAQ